MECASPCDGVGRGAVRLLEVSSGFAALSDGVFGLAEREQQLGACRAGGWLGDGTAQQRHGGRGCSPRAGFLGGQPQLADDALVAGRRGVHELQCDALWARAARAQQAGRAQVRGGTLGRGLVRPRGSRKDRVAERKHAASSRMPAHQIPGRRRGLAQREVRELGSQAEIDVIAQHRRRPGERAGRGAEALEGGSHRARDGRRGGLRDLCGALPR